MSKGSSKDSSDNSGPSGPEYEGTSSESETDKSLEALDGQSISAQVKYVLGFMFDEELRNVALIRKIKPKWQEGKWNGIGGK
jgi:hypothetical protein